MTMYELVCVIGSVVGFIGMLGISYMYDGIVYRVVDAVSTWALQVVGVVEELPVPLFSEEEIQEYCDSHVSRTHLPPLV